MSINYPEELDDFIEPTGEDFLDELDHSQQHSDINLAVEELEKKVGIDNSEDPDSIDYKLRFSIPSGGIIIWSGAVDNIPAGWLLCNGENDTPDLRDRFIVGAGNDYIVGATGGENTHILTIAEMPSHNHSGSSGSAGGHGHSASSGSTGSHGHSGSTGSAGGHSHNYERSNYASVGRLMGSLAVNYDRSTVATSSAGGHSHSVSIDSAGSHAHSVSIGSVDNHSHSVSVGNKGDGQAHENRPPYYALAFIMKI